ncbi:DUF2093 domain-containing protein [Martelella alba]|uniref:DUF2093 domain-containing protein n=1 Tax=Martelella alba TaxID=2590451 RepID=A0A506UGC0_9HYPH|nr:DUF2093 domain-containing protein [Martelella alba]TPW32461.1 DUF2093 domain-containing protein [Martelella alba]
MNILEGNGRGEARIKYLDADFEVIVPGTHVVCAVTGQRIPLEELRYWSVARQEAYVDAAVSFEAEKRAGTLPLSAK